ncbi:MAG: efflux RND transporter periplasmic adaptor subunit [Anaerolineae bacterium]|nr:efflux RND transporter periplasmic adaptor subunit [Anaerolineae bacterium]
MKKFLGWIIFLALIGGGIGGYWWWQQQSQPAAEEVLRTGQVAREDLEITVVASGNVAVNQETDLRFDLTGTVAEVTVEVGDTVRAGQVLARLDTADLDRAVAQARIALEQAEINLVQLTQPADEADIEQAKLEMQNAAAVMETSRLSQQAAEVEGNIDIEAAEEARDDAKDAYDGTWDTIKKYGLDNVYGVYVTAAYMEADGNVGVTRMQLEYEVKQAQSQWLTAYHSYQQAADRLKTLDEGPDEEDIQQAELKIEQAKLDLEQAEGNLPQAIIEAPFAGVVATVNLQEGVAVPTGVPAFSLLDTTTLYVEVMVDETDIGKVAVGQAVEVILDAYPDVTLAGVVERITSAPSNTSGVIAYPVEVRLTADNTVEVRDGMTASVVIRTRVLEDVLLVPNWAVRTDQVTNETYTYYSKSPEAIERIPITVGQRNERYTEVRSGLEEGQTVVLIAEERNLLEYSGPPQ